MPGTIRDPKMNPKGERTFGILFNHDDSHSYVYIKQDDDIESDYEGSRYFTAGTRVDLGDIFPVFLVKPTLNDNQIKKYKDLDFNSDDDLKQFLLEKGRQLEEALTKCDLDFMKVVDCKWKEEPVIFDLIDIKKAPDTPGKQPVIDKLNKKAKDELKKPKK